MLDRPQCPCPVRILMNTISTILSRHPAIFSVFVITPEETVVHARSHAATEPPPCPANHLNSFFHNATRLMPDSREVSLCFGATSVTLRPLPLDWVMAVCHEPGCDTAPFDALQVLARDFAKTEEELEEQAFSILTPDAVMMGALGHWLVPMMKLLQEVTGEPPQRLFHQALNEWIDREEPSHGGLVHFATILTAAIADPNHRTLYAEKAKGILTSGENMEKGESMP